MTDVQAHNARVEEIHHAVKVSHKQNISRAANFETINEDWVFVPSRAVAPICEKYDLAFVRLPLFTGPVPKKAARAMRKLRRQVRRLPDHLKTYRGKAISAQIEDFHGHEFRSDFEEVQYHGRSAYKQYLDPHIFCDKEAVKIPNSLYFIDGNGRMIDPVICIPVRGGYLTHPDMMWGKEAEYEEFQPLWKRFVNSIKNMLP